MRRTIFWVALVLAAAFAGNGWCGEADNPDALLGTWLTAEGKSKVEVYKCGEFFCGKIVWLKEPNREDGTAKLDRENPEESLQSRPIMGLEILTGVKYREPNRWGDGKIYDPNNGKTYSCKMEMEGDKLNFRGFIGISLLGRTTEWQRVK